jgi:Ca2+-binding RTX toxin-like protein
MLTFVDLTNSDVVSDAAEGTGLVGGPLKDANGNSYYMGEPLSSSEAAVISVMNLLASQNAAVQASVASPWELMGGDANDVLSGGFSGNIVFGEGGNDTLGGAFGSNLLNGGTGNDTLYAGIMPGLYIGGDGTDTLVLPSSSGNVNLCATSIVYTDPTTSTTSVLTGYAAVDTFTGVNYGFIDSSVENVTFAGSGTTVSLATLASTNSL